MLYRPWPIVTVGLFFLVAPFINVLTSSLLLQVSLSQYILMQLRLDPVVFVSFIVLPVLCGLSLLTFRKWSYYLFLTFMVGICLYVLAQRFLHPHRISIGMFLGFELLNFAVILYFLSPQVKLVYLNKRIRWWQQKPRFLISSPAEVLVDNHRTAAHLENLSEGGALITTAKTLPPQSQILIETQILGESLALPGLVIHGNNGHYGILFEDRLDTHFKLKSLVKRLKREKVPIRGRELTSWESFVKWGKELLVSGHGFLPELPGGGRKS